MAKHLPRPDKQLSKSRAKAFEEAEASLLLEGLDPTLDPAYRTIKARLIADTASFDEAEAAIKARYFATVAASA